MVFFLFNATSFKFFANITAAIVWLLIFSPPCFAQIRIPDNIAYIDMTIQDNVISADLRDARLQDILLAVGKQLGCVLHLTGDLSERLTLSFSSLPLEKGLKRLTGRHSLSLVYNRIPPPVSQGDETIKDISGIWVFSRSPAKTSNLPQAEQPDDAASLQRALDELRRSGDDAAVMAVAAFLRHEQKEFRRKAVEGICSVQSTDAAQALVPVLSDEPDAKIRLTALRALVYRFNDPNTQIAVTKALSDPDEEIQKLATQLLEQ